MRGQHLLLLTLVCLAGPGCSVVRYGTKNLVEAPCDVENRWTSHCRSHYLADDAWKKFKSADPAHAYSDDFVHGFRRGFIDYLEFGGTGQPPVVPPWHYFKTKYETPEGHAAINDWFEGFRVGAAAAQDSGVRDFVVLPLAKRASTNPDRYYGGSTQEMPGATEQVLPLPKAVPAPGNQPMSQAPASGPGRVMAVVWIPPTKPGQSAAQGAPAAPMKITYTAPSPPSVTRPRSSVVQSVRPNSVAVSPALVPSARPAESATAAPGTVASRPVLMNFTVPAALDVPVHMNYVNPGSAPATTRPATLAEPLPSQRMAPMPVSRANPDAAAVPVHPLSAPRPSLGEPRASARRPVSADVTAVEEPVTWKQRSSRWDF